MAIGASGGQAPTGVPALRTGEELLREAVRQVPSLVVLSVLAWQFVSVQAEAFERLAVAIERQSAAVSELREGVAGLVAVERRSR